MKQKLIQLSQRYVTALRKYLKQGARAKLQPALRLGSQAAALGLETLELARIHEQALKRLKLSGDKNQAVKPAGIFFAEANSSIEATHGSASQTNIHLNRLYKKLDRRAVELAATNRQLHQGIIRRRVIEDAAKKRGQHHQKCLEESLQLQKHLQQLTHRVMATQEDERKSISRELRDEIAQTLLGINVQLLSLKLEAGNNTQGLKNEIASTQRLVVKSVKSVRRFARKLDGHQPA